MSQDQQCITTHFRGSSSRSDTRTYVEQRDQNDRERFVITVFGIISLGLGVGPIIVRSYARRKNDNNAEDEHMKSGMSRGADHRSFMDVTLEEAYRRAITYLKSLWRSSSKTTQHPGSTRNKSDLEIEFNNVFFNRTIADREGIIRHWMKVKSVDRAAAMRHAIEEWRRANR